MKVATRKAIGILLVALLYCPGVVSHPATEDDPRKKALTVLETRCNTCHKVANPRKVFTNTSMETYATQIYRQVFIKQRMPKGDKLTIEEEQALKQWIEALRK
jgi:uncharacterized membrane protein